MELPSAASDVRGNGENQMNECYICKNHHTQHGDCWLNIKNCLLFEEEQRGVISYRDFGISFNPFDISIIKVGEFVETEDGREIKIIKIKDVDLSQRLIHIEGGYYEKEVTPEMKRAEFKVLNGGKREI